MSSARLSLLAVLAGVSAAAFTLGGILAGAAPSAVPSSLVPIVPCRLVDTRPGSNHVGVRAAPLGPGESLTLAVWGTNGNCTIPSSATAIVSNVTIDRPTAASYLTVYPPDAARPLSSNLNWTETSPPTPNQVTSVLSAAGALAVYNDAGSVEVIIDIVGYYVPDAAGGAGPPGARGLSAWDVIPSGQTVTGTIEWDVHGGSGSDALGVDLPGVAPAALANTDVNVGASAGTGDDDPSCDGTVSSPSAPSGKVCIYLATASNIDLDTFQGNAGLLPDRSFRIVWFPIAATTDEDSYFSATWAYRAP